MDGNKGNEVGHIWRKIEIIGRLLVPLALGILVYIANQTANKIAESQYNSAQQEKETNLELKYLEIFYQEISSKDLSRQRMALAILRAMQPNLALKLAAAVSQDKSKQEEIRTEAESIRKDIEKFGQVNRYKIGIYFPKDRDDLRKIALKLKEGLINQGIRSIIQLYEKDNSFFRRVGFPKGFEVRFEEPYEDEVADQLVNLLSEIYPTRKFSKRTVRNRTVNFISVFLGP